MVLWRLTARATQGGPLSNGNSSRDADAVSLWDEAYGPAHLKDQQNLWGDPPVPYAVRAAELFKENSSRVVIDLPCGDGRNLAPLANGTSILLGGDTSATAMTIAERVAAREGIAAKTVFVRMDAFDTGLLDNSVDGIFCWDLLGHLTNVEDALKELYRVIRPGGIIVANMWTMNDCQTSDPDIREIAPKEYIDHFDFYCRFYDQADLETLLTATGMAAESVVVSAWTEPAHADYRTYEHDHESLAFTIRKGLDEHAAR
jgi:ubiquinone/menaquinone biosynthesis C-methylase UbiE